MQARDISQKSCRALVNKAAVVDQHKDITMPLAAVLIAVLTVLSSTISLATSSQGQCLPLQYKNTLW